MRSALAHEKTPLSNKAVFMCTCIHLVNAVVYPQLMGQKEMVNYTKFGAIHEVRQVKSIDCEV